MNLSTIRRLASDHASLYNSELPPYYLFPSGASMPDDLTQLTILLTGPQGTPYASGVWKLFLKIPHDYPRSPPKASFRTKIWHPNVEESTGSVCLDTLKRDWQPKLTLRDILMTNSCLLIQPNPDSALNAAAGKLLQEDYEAFSRQAKLMTSIHAPIPNSLQDAVAAAKNRGNEPKTTQLVASKKKRPFHTLEDGGKPFSAPMAPGYDEDTSDDEATASKENEPKFCPSLFEPPIPIPRRPTLAKRPLSDLPTPIDSESDNEDEACMGMTSSERNVAANTPNLSSDVACMAVSDHHGISSKLAERTRSIGYVSGRKVEGATGLTIALPIAIPELADGISAPEQESDEPVAKRICSGEGKENLNNGQGIKAVIVSNPISVRGTAITFPAVISGVSKVSNATAVSGVRNTRIVPRPRVGLRRL